MKNKTFTIKPFAGTWTIVGQLPKADKTVLPSFRGKYLCLNSTGVFYYANRSELVVCYETK